LRRSVKDFFRQNAKTDPSVLHQSMHNPVSALVAVVLALWQDSGAQSYTRNHMREVPRISLRDESQCLWHRQVGGRQAWRRDYSSLQAPAVQPRSSPSFDRSYPLCAMPCEALSSTLPRENINGLCRRTWQTNKPKPKTTYCSVHIQPPAAHSRFMCIEGVPIRTTDAHLVFELKLLGISALHGKWVGKLTACNLRQVRSTWQLAYSL